MQRLFPVSFIDDETVEGQIKGTDADNDLAVVAVKLSDIKDEDKEPDQNCRDGEIPMTLRVGDQVVAIGNALGTSQSLTSGYISAKTVRSPVGMRVPARRLLLRD